MLHTLRLAIPNVALVRSGIVPRRPPLMVRAFGSYEDERRIAECLLNEAYVEGKRVKLPKRVTEGRSVWLAHIWVERDHLPGKRVTSKRLPCAVVWNDPKAPICTRQQSPKERRHADDDDEA